MDHFVSIHLDRGSDKPLYIQLYEGIVRLIEEKKLSPGEKLPTIRKLSSLLKVNTVTVVNAYRLLEREGYVVSRVGSGTYVRSAVKSINEGEMREDISEERSSVHQVPYDFAGAFIPPEYFPVEDFKRAINKVLDRDGGYAFSYSESQGYLPFRHSLGKYLAKEYAIEVPVHLIHVVSGAQQGIDIISKALLDFGDVVFVESPTYPGAIDAFKSRGARIVEIPLTQDGPDMDELVARLRLKPPKIFYTMPNFQNPTGYSYSEQKKKELLALSRKYDFLIIEDDHMNDLYYEERPLPLKNLDAEGRVFYIKGFSKLFMPGLRLGFIVAPEPFSKKLQEVKYFSDITSSELAQRALDVMLKDGSFYDHADKMREIFRERWNIALKAMKKHFPAGVYWSKPSGGLFFWITLPDGCYSMNLYGKAIKNGILITPGDFFYPDRRPTTSFRLSIAQIPSEKLEEGIKLLAGCIAELLEEYRIDPLKGDMYKPLL
ncbi:2-aminoadipate transaminase [Fervidicola ferrireducens]|uniref:2-aminoadipate transaminase n=1 Tax=Fervidicola ferrireducens TaxID=520764 RepID=A0A140L7K4_9FIRM|nr:PLP-dependent aminotransferase family protein [Fervidicola ferrireducens]KXG76529.1 2-aminoadipate transaminase [Fervidicola ferrireducens]